MIEQAYLPPQNIEAERSLLGACIIGGRPAVDEASLIIEATDFYRESHRVIFEMLIKLSFNDTVIDIVTLKEALGERLEKVGGLTYLMELAGSTFSTVSIKSHAEIVKDKSLARGKILQNLEENRQLMAGECQPEAMISRSMIDSMNLLNRKQRGQILPLSAGLKETFDSIERSVGLKGITGLSTGFDDLDHITGGLQTGYYILAARTSVGKTTCALNIARNISKQGKKVLVFSLEMTRPQLTRKMLSKEAKVDSRLFNNAEKITDQQWIMLSHSLGALEQAEIYIDDTSGLKASEIMIRARSFQSMNPDLGAIIIDYIQLMSAEREDGNTNDKVSTTSKLIKVMSKDLDLPVIAISQLSREVDKRKDQMPQLADLRDSGSLEQDADVVWFLYRPDYYEPEKAAPGPSVTHLIMPKNRLDGGIGGIRLLYFKETQHFQPINKPKPQERLTQQPLIKGQEHKDWWPEKEEGDGK